MTHVFHRHLRVNAPDRGVGARHVHPRRGRQGVPRRLRRRGGLLPRSRPPGRAGRDPRAGGQARLRAHQLLHLRARRGAGRPADPHRPRGHEPRLHRLRRIRGGRGVAQDGAPVLRRDRAAATVAVRRPPAELPRQHARRARRRRQRMAAPPVRAAPDRRRARVAVLSVPRPAAGRDVGGLWPPARRRARHDPPAPRTGQGDRVRRRDRRRRDRRRARAGARLLQGGARGLRPPRGAADPRRGHGGHGPLRLAARLRAGGHRPRPDHDREGPGRRLPADRGRAGAAAHRRRDERRQRLLPARPHLPRPPGRLRRGARRAARDRARRAAVAGAAPRRDPGDDAARAVRQPPARRRHPRTRPVLRHRARRRPHHEGAVRPGAASCTPASSAKAWRGA